MGNIRMTLEDNIGNIIIDNPEKLNCLEMSMLEDLEHIHQQIIDEKNIRVIKIQGAGNKAFSTGANLNEFNRLDESGIADWIRYGNKVFNKLESLPIPTIAAINGFALGGGLELALTCDVRIATENSSFAFPELKHGWIPGWGGLSRLRRLTGEGRAKHIIMLGERFNAQHALDWGIISKVCPSNQMEEVITPIVDHLTELEPIVFEMAKNALMDGNRSTSSNDILFEVLATQYSKKNANQ